MITLSNDYLTQKERLENGTSTLSINPSDEPLVYIDSNKRIIDSNNVLNQFVTVESDHNAETIYFVIDRYFEGVDLSKKECIIKYKTLRNVINFDKAVNVHINSNGRLVIGWKLTQQVTEYIGNVPFQVMFYSIEFENLTYFDYVFNTTTATLIIHRRL